jgi:hypothetical protein
LKIAKFGVNYTYMKRKTLLKAIAGIPVIGVLAQKAMSPYERAEYHKEYWEKKTAENLAKVKDKPGLHRISPSCAIEIPDNSDFSASAVPPSTRYHAATTYNRCSA